MARIEKKVTHEEFDEAINKYPTVLYVEEFKMVPPFTRTYIKGTVKATGKNQEDIVGIARLYSQDRNHPDQEDAYYLYEDQQG